MQVVRILLDTKGARIALLALMALLLTILPLPRILAVLSPNWVLILVLYLETYEAYYFKLSALFLIGIILDVLLASVIGEHIFALFSVALLAFFNARLFKLYSLLQQTLLIGAYCLFYEIIIYLINLNFGFGASFWLCCPSVVTSMILWPWLITIFIGRTVDKM